MFGDASAPPASPPSPAGSEPGSARKGQKPPARPIVQHSLASAEAQVGLSFSAGGRRAAFHISVWLLLTSRVRCDEGRDGAQTSVWSAWKSCSKSKHASLAYLNNKDKCYFPLIFFPPPRRRRSKSPFSSRMCALMTDEKNQICFLSDRI